MKKVILLFAVAALAIGANAQKAGKVGGLRFGLGVRGAIPTTTSINSFAIGGEAMAEFHFSKASVVGSVAYMSWQIKDQYKSGYKAGGEIPIMAGARYYFIQQFFAGAKLGYSVSAQTGGVGGFAWEPQVGFNLSHFQGSLGYYNISRTGGSTGAVAATFTYKF